MKRFHSVFSVQFCPVQHKKRKFVAKSFVIIQQKSEKSLTLFLRQRSQRADANTFAKSSMHNISGLVLPRIPIPGETKVLRDIELVFQEPAPLPYVEDS